MFLCNVCGCLFASFKPVFRGVVCIVCLCMYVGLNQCIYSPEICCALTVLSVCNNSGWKLTRKEALRLHLKAIGSHNCPVIS